MLKYTTGDILNADAEALVNTVNCVGIMGRGIALQFKKAFPKNFQTYAAACKRDEVQPGKMLVFETGTMTNPKYIINFPTKRHWKGKSRMGDIEIGLDALVQEIRQRGIKSVAIPPLGSGLGGLHWPEVRQRIEGALSDLPEVDALVFEPNGAPDPKVMARTRSAPSMTSGRAALVALMHRYLDGLMDPFVTLLEVHKLMYFLQEAGEPLRLRYVEHHYGPYSENLRHVLRDIEGHLVSGYADGGDKPTKPLELVPGAIKDSHQYLETHEGVRANLQRVAELVSGFETPFGLELLSTVHWILKNSEAETFDEVVQQVHAWSEHKRKFSPRQVEIAVRTLNEKGWIQSQKHLSTTACLH